MEVHGASFAPHHLPTKFTLKQTESGALKKKAVQKVNEGIMPEFIGIVNYSVMALIQLELGAAEEPDLKSEQVFTLYEKYFMLQNL